MYDGSEVFRDADGDLWQAIAATDTIQSVSGEIPGQYTLAKVNGAYGPMEQASWHTVTV